MIFTEINDVHNTWENIEDTEITLLKIVSIQMCATKIATAVYGSLANVMFVCFSLKI